MDSRDKGRDGREVVLALLASQSHHLTDLKDAVSMNSVTSALGTWHKLMHEHYDPAAQGAEITHRCQRFYFFSPLSIFHRIKPAVFHLLGLDQSLLIEAPYVAAEQKSQRQLWQEIYAAAAERIKRHGLKDAVIPVLVRGYEEYAEQCAASTPQRARLDWPSFGQDWLDFNDLTRENGDLAAFRTLTADRDAVKAANCRLVIITHMATGAPAAHTRLASNSWRTGPSSRQVIEIEQ